MSNEAYSANRWTEVPKFSEAGSFEISEEEKKQYDIALEGLMRENGVLDPKQSSNND